MKVWYKNIGDTKPTMATHRNEYRPGEKFIETDDYIPAKYANLIKLAWTGNVPAPILPTDAEMTGQDNARNIKVEKERNKLTPPERMILALRHEFNGIATQQDTKILDKLQTRFAKQ